MKNLLSDDKALVILAVLTIGLAVIFSGPLGASETTIISSVLSGLFGVAVGRSGNQ